MFREIRRKKQSLNMTEAEEILKNGTSGVLAVVGDDGFPYAVPLSYVYENGKIYFHSATQGHKIDSIKKNGKASFCVVGQDCVVPERYTTNYKSVIVFGTARILQSDDEKSAAIKLLAEKYRPNHTEENCCEIEKSYGRFCMVELDVEHISGKESSELAGRRQIKK